MRLTFLEYRIMPKNFALALMVIMMSIFFISHINNYVEELGQATAYAGGYAGEMPMNYDFELLAQSLEFDGLKEADISYLSTYEKNGIMDEDMKIFEDIAGIKSINGYKLTDKILIIKEKGKFDKYLDISDTYLDGEYSIKSLKGEIRIKGRDELMKLIGYEENTIIQTEMLGLTDKDLFLMNEYVTEGHKARSLNFAAYEDENSINDTLFNVGDEITLSEYKVLANMNSGISENDIPRI